jgi:hypothetical protein
MFFIIQLLGTEWLPIAYKQLMFNFDIGKHQLYFAIGRWACNIPIFPWVFFIGHMLQVFVIFYSCLKSY